MTDKHPLNITLFNKFYLVSLVLIYVCLQTLQVEFHPFPVICLTWNLAYLCESDDNTINW